MSWLDIFKRKPRAPRAPYGVAIVNDVPPQTGNPTVPLITQITGHKPGQGKKTYTAKEVAEAGVSKAEVEELLVDIITKSYIAARNGAITITFTHDNILALYMAAKDLKRSGYKVTLTPGRPLSLPYITVSWEHP